VLGAALTYKSVFNDEVMRGAETVKPDPELLKRVRERGEGVR